MPGTTHYVLTAADRIRSVGPEWDEIAGESAAAGTPAEAVLGRSLYDFVADAETAAFLRDVFASCRAKGEVFETSYRCDGPATLRLFHMVVLPLPDGELHVQSDLVVDCSYPVAAAPAAAPEARGDALRCSSCCAIRVADQWFDAADRADRDSFPLIWGVCPDCRTETADAMARPRGPEAEDVARRREARIGRPLVVRRQGGDCDPA